MNGFLAIKLLLLSFLISLIQGNLRNGCSQYKRPLTGNVDNTRQGFFNCWGVDVESGKSELVILIDTSGSMWSSGEFQGQSQTGFQIAKTFVKALLSEVRVAFNATRVAVGTFSSDHRINFNYILNPTYSNTKCKFMDDFKRLNFDGEMTNIKGTLNDAYNIFRQLDSYPDRHLKRTRSNKVVILLTDGKGNVGGSDATPEANRLKQIGYVEVYTIGVTTDVDSGMLKKIATDKSLYLQASSFTDLGNLAFNIRGDPYEKDYETFQVNPNLCDPTCDPNALCGCNLKSGDYRCVCKRGYYGTGERKNVGQSCFECPKNTYGDRRGYLTDCPKCPENSETRNIPGKPALSLRDCHCKNGYKGSPQNGYTCKPKACKPPPDVNFARIVNKVECEKQVFETKCYYQCKPNYKMVTSKDYTQCNSGGVWEFPYPKCELISCKASWDLLDASKKFSVQCNSTLLDKVDQTYVASTKCDFNCRNQYYAHSGSSSIQCLPSGEWNSDSLDCRVSECPIIPKLHKVITVLNPNFNCFENVLKVGDQCKFFCPSGYSLRGRGVFECLNSNSRIGNWNVDTSITANIPTCIDVEKPEFTDSYRCDTGISIVKETLKGKNYAEINFEIINATDNSGEPVEVTCWIGDEECPYEMGKTYEIEVTKSIDVKFKATDTSGNARTCLFQISILDKEKPTITYCPDNIVEKTSDLSKTVKWNEVEFTDNCGVYPECDVQSTSNIASGSVFVRDVPTTVSYIIRDPSNNINEDCKFDVKVAAMGCSTPEPPRNGIVIVNANIAQAYCSKGNYPNAQMSNLYICIGGMWMAPGGMGVFPFPDCVAKNPPNGMSQQMILLLQFEGDCSKKAIQGQVKTRFKTYTGIGESLDKIDLYCGSSGLLSRRRKRSVKQLSMKVTILTKVSKEEASKDPYSVLNILRSKMDSFISPQFIKDMKKFRKWRSVNKYLASLYRVNKIGSTEEKCGEVGDMENDAEPELKKRCVVCGAGEFKNLLTGKCEKCPPGQYQPNPGQTQCLECPGGTIIIGDDTKNYTSCKTTCKPGEYSPNGLAPCYKCPTSSYSDKVMSKTCNTCPVGTVTLTTGAASLYDCGTACQRGTYSSNGVEPCTRCPKGYFQSKYGSQKCNACPDLTSTAGKGSMSIGSCVAIDDCASNPCMNQGNCIDLKDNYRCECNAGYWGKNCELEVDECRFRPCINNGTCLDKFQSYKCMCQTGAAGENCDQVVSKCQQNICSQHGKCIDAADQKFKCICDDFYTGEFCETKIDPCYPDPCGNEGHCIRKWDSQGFQCQCKTGFSGETCKVKLNNCGSNPCKNGATCIDQTIGYSCLCQPGYNGVQCQTLINMCVYKKCHNGGECISRVNDVECRCAPGFTGKQCDHVESSNFDISLQSRVSPSYASIHGRKDMPQFTLAFWMRTSDTENIGTPVSYAVKSNGKLDDNALVLTDYSNFNLLLNNETQSLEFDANDGEWHHIAVKWNNKNGVWTAYKNGIEIRRAKSPMQKGKFIPRGGIFVIGEEQDGYGDNFTPSESFIGDMSQLNIWDRELSANEIYDLAMSCHHESGNVVAWADFGTRKTGSVISTSPSLACNFNSVLREFQYFEDSNLPQQLLNKDPKISYPRITSAFLCAKECIARQEWCRSFTFTKYSSTASCQLFSASSLIAGVQPISKFGTDLYLMSCVRPLGMSSRAISDKQITASSTKGTAHPWLARLYLTPSGNERIKFWQPLDGVKSYIQVELGRLTQITGIATQGHFDKTVKEFATSYRIKYKSSGVWKWYKNAMVISANNAPVKTVRTELHLVTSSIQIYVNHDGRSNRIAFRFELYGCPMKPQGTPDKKADRDQCNSSPCLNGGICYDLYQRYKCVCPYGYHGDQCQDTVVCKKGDLDVPINGKLLMVGTMGMYFCNPGFQFKYKGILPAACHSGKWVNAQQQNCEDVDECQLNKCSDGCENTIGSFKCTCPRGKYLSSDGRTCLDMNECARRIDGCVNGCTNTDGGYKCICKKGFYSPGERMCHDFNECGSKANNCEQICENTLGSFRCKCKPGYRLNNDGRTCEFIKCPSLRNIQHGNVKTTGDISAYTCTDGWKIDGFKERYCLADGTWSGIEPKCSSIKCVPLLAPENGSIRRRTGNSYNDQVHFECNPGFILIGSSRRACSSNSEWDGVSPMCITQVCQHFAVINGKLLGFGTVVGSVVRVQCNKGFVLRQKNSEFLKCETNGKWSGGLQSIACDPIFCGVVESKGHVIVSYVNGQGYNALARYACPAGQCLEGNQVRRCQANGKWSGEAPVCKKNSCCKPFVPKEAKLYSDDIYGKDSAAFIKCNDGFTTGGEEFRECKENVKSYEWSGADTTCSIVDCGDPGTPTNGKRHITHTTYLSTVTFFCKPQYLMSGSSERTCQSNGKWSGTQPKCRLGNNGGHVAAKSGKLKCLGHDTCHWLIEVTQGAKVTITVNELNLADGETMKVYDGQSWEPFVVFTNRTRPLPVTSNTHFMRVITSGYISFTFSQSNCGGMFSAAHGVITSPNYPKNYPPNLDCYWTIHRPYNRLELRFTDFLIQRRSVDYVTVREGPFEGSDYLLYHYFLDKIPWLTKDWADRWYWIHFHSDVRYANRGFQALYSNYEPRV